MARGTLGGVDETLEAEVARRAKADGLLLPGERVLVGVSAGCDSAATAALLAAGAGHGLPLTLVLGHVDHGWRGPAEAAADRETVERLAALLSLPLRFAGPPAVVRRTEDDARRHRYTSLATLAREASCAKVVTGHHLRDQAETLLMRLERGSGPAGLAGIPPKRPLQGGPLEVVRPVLWVDPARLRVYALDRGLPFREDVTNAEVDRDRARVRARLVALGERQAVLVSDLGRTAERLRRRLARREAEVVTRLAPSMRHHVEAEAVEVSREALAEMPPATMATALRVLGRPLSADRDGPWFGNRHADLVRETVSRGVGGVPLPKGLRLEVFGARVVLWRGVPSADRPTLTVRRADVPRAGFDLEAWTAARRAGGTGASWHAAFDADVLGPGLTFREVRPEDRFVPFGRTSGVGVSEFLSRQGVPYPLRRGVRVAVTADGRIAWVLGHRIDARCAVSERTATVAVVDAWLDGPERRR